MSKPPLVSLIAKTHPEISVVDPANRIVEVKMTNEQRAELKSLIDAENNAGWRGNDLFPGYSPKCLFVLAITANVLAVICAGIAFVSVYKFAWLGTTARTFELSFSAMNLLLMLGALLAASPKDHSARLFANALFFLLFCLAFATVIWFAFVNKEGETGELAPKPGKVAVAIAVQVVSTWFYLANLSVNPETERSVGARCIDAVRANPVTSLALLAMLLVAAWMSRLS